MKVVYGSLRADSQKANGDWEFDKLTGDVYAEVTCKTEVDFDLFAEKMSVHGFNASECPTTEDNSYTDTFYFHKSEKRDFKESYKMVKGRT